MDGGEEGVDAQERGRGNGNADNRQRRVGGDYTGQVCGIAGPGDDDAHPATRRGKGQLAHDLGGSVGRRDAELRVYPERLQAVDGGFHNPEV